MACGLCGGGGYAEPPAWWDTSTPDAGLDLTKELKNNEIYEIYVNTKQHSLHSIKERMAFFRKTSETTSLLTLRVRCVRSRVARALRAWR